MPTSRAAPRAAAVSASSSHRARRTRADAEGEAEVTGGLPDEARRQHGREGEGEPAALETVADAVGSGGDGGQEQ